MRRRSALPKENGQLTSGCVVTRPVSLRARPRATNTDSLVRSAIETRDIATLAPLHAGVDPAGGNIANGGPAANPRESFKSFAGARHRSRRARTCANPYHRSGRGA